MEEQFISKKELEELLSIILSGERSYILQDKKTLLKESREEILAIYLSNLAAWYIYLGYYILLEEYEVCADIRKAISMERETFKDFLKTERDDLENDFPDMIEYIVHMEEDLDKTISNIDFDGERNDC